MTSTAESPDLAMEHPLPGDLLASAHAATQRMRELAVQQLVLACEWADSHPLLADEPHPGGGRAARRAREAALRDERRRIAADWLATHDPDNDFASGWSPEDRGADPWLPEYSWSCVAPLAAAMGLSTAAGQRLLEEALILRHRLPTLWARTLAGEVEAWRARRIATRAWREPEDVVDALDSEVTPVAHSIGMSGLDGLVDEITARLHAETRELDQIAALDHRSVVLLPEVGPTGMAEIAIRADLADAWAFDQACTAVAAALLAQQEAAGVVVPESLDVRRSRAVGILADPALAQALLADPAGADPDNLPGSRPLGRSVQLVVHLTPELRTALDGVSGLDIAPTPTAWMGTGVRTGLKAQLTEAVAQWCGRPASAITVQPVIDLTTHETSTSAQVADKHRARTALTRTTCVFPHCQQPSTRCDADHTIPAESGGATCDCNLHPLCRRHHRLKTFAGWTYLVIPGPKPDGSSPPGSATYVWTDPHRQHFVVDRHGTRDVTPSESGCRVKTP